MAQFLGRVVGTRMQKTAKVEVVRMVLHPHVLKYIQRRKNFLVHDPNEECQDGDMVVIRECRPYSKRKAFIVTEIVDKAKSHKDPKSGQVFYQTMAS